MVGLGFLRLKYGLPGSWKAAFADVILWRKAKLSTVRPQGFLLNS